MDNLFLKDNLAGDVPVEISREIMKNIIEQASILKVSKRIPMSSDTMVIPKLASTGSAAWINEGEEIGTTLPTFEYPQLKAKKLAVIVPVTREKINDSVANVINEVKQAITDMFARAIDLACIFGVNSPFETNIVASIGANKVEAPSKIYTGLSDAMGLVEENNYVCSNILTSTRLKKVLRELADDNAHKGAITLTSAYDTPIEYVRNWGDTDNLFITGDFSRSIVGTRENMKYEILKEASIKNGSEIINLAQRDLIGIKCTLRMAYLVADAKAFSMVSAIAH